MKYLIHSCGSRQWYVEKFLIPSMLEQGIKETDIYNYCDTDNKGNLSSWRESCKLPVIVDNPDESIWHIQDDVAISSTFASNTRLERFNEYDIVCGFICQYDEDRKAGPTNTMQMWFSFPCIKIPNWLLIEFTKWADAELSDIQFRFWVNQNKGDDLVFRVFLEEEHPDLKVLNLAPNLVDHIDYLLGGTMVNKQRGSIIVRSKYWKEPALIKELEQKILKYRLVIQ